MTPVYGSNDELAVYWHQPGAAELLEAGEIPCEVEGATLGTNWGVLVVTDLRALFVSRAFLRRRFKCRFSTRLEDIHAAEADERPTLMGKRVKGVVTLLVPGRPEERIDFEHIDGGRERAEQIVTTILRQKRFLEK